MKTLLAVAALIALANLVEVDRMSVAPLLAQDRVAKVLAQVRAALGGEEKLAAVKAIRAEGPFRRSLGQRSTDGDISLLVVRPDKLRRSEESMFFGSAVERVSTFNGTQAWENNTSAARVGGGGGDHAHGSGDFAGLVGGGGVDHPHFQAQAQGAGPGSGLTEEQVKSARVRRMKTELQRWNIALFADSNQPFSDAGVANSPDGKADILETVDDTGRAVRYLIDQTSHLPLMVQYQEVRPQVRLDAPRAPGATGRPSEAETNRRIEEMRAQGSPRPSAMAMHLSEYKKVDGVMLPHRIDISVDGQPNEAWTIEKYKINPAVKADVFQEKAK